MSSLSERERRGWRLPLRALWLVEVEVDPRLEGAKLELRREAFLLSPYCRDDLSPDKLSLLDVQPSRLATLSTLVAPAGALDEGQDGLRSVLRDARWFSKAETLALSGPNPIVIENRCLRRSALVVRSGAAGLESVPWPLLSEVAPNDPFPPDLQVRRWPEWASNERPSPHDPPELLHIAFDDCDAPGSFPSDGSFLYDALHIEPGSGFDWQHVSALGAERAAVLHVAAPRDAAAAVPIVPAWGAGGAPQLVVIHGIGGPSGRHLPPEAAVIMDTFVKAGADAALYVASSDASAILSFVESFYFNIFEGRLLVDQAAAQALSKDARVEASLTLRRGAEIELSRLELKAPRSGTLRPRGIPSVVNPAAASEGLEPGSLAGGDEQPVFARLTPRGDERLYDAPLTKRGARWVRNEVNSFIESLRGAPQRAADRWLGPDGVLADLQQALSAKKERALAEKVAATIDDTDAATVARRSTNVWVEASRGSVVRHPLRVGRLYSLAVAVQVQAPQKAIAVLPFPERVVRDFFRERGEIELDVSAFADEDDVAFRAVSGKLRLLSLGDSSTLRLPFRALREGAFRVQIALYFEGRVLQSIAVDLRSVPEGPPASPSPDHPARLEWAETLDFAELDALPPAGASLVVNRDPEGTHWFMMRHPEGRPLLRKYRDDALMHKLAGLTGALKAPIVEGECGARLDPQGVDWAYRAERLIDIAKAGWLASSDLFYRAALDSDSSDLVTIARCDLSRPNLPWAALYRFPLDVNRPLSLCAIFFEQVRGTQWQRAKVGGDEVAAPVRRLDLLDDEASCRASPGCPLASPERAALTVCPFGFWGIRNVIEQPLQQVPPGERGERRLCDPRFSEAPALGPQPDQPTLARLGIDRGFAAELSEKHARSVETLFGAGEFERTDERDRVLAWMREGGPPLLYLFCHGERDDQEIFRLRFGEGDFIGPSQLGEAPWRRPGLVVLNGCDTVAPTPELLHGFVERLRDAGAVAVVGTEISVYTEIAGEFGLLLLSRLRSGAQLGDAMLALRREYMRQLNPIGLAYTFYAQAQVHLHAGPPTQAACCETRRPPRARPPGA